MTLSEMLRWLRAFGYMVGVHNDFKLNGKFHTFWLFTHPATGTFLKGEGSTDEWAVGDVISQLPEAYRKELEDGVRA